MSNAYIVTRVLRAPCTYSPGATGFGAVEIRSGETDLPSEKEALARSEEAFGEPPPKSPLSMRICAACNAGSAFEADRAVEPHLEEVLDIVDCSGVNFDKHGLSPVGYVRNLDTGILVPRVPDWEFKSWPPMSSFRMNAGRFQLPSFEQILAFGTQTDLIERLKRSFHWRRKARWESNIQVRVLFRWFAMEALWTLARNDDIVPWVLWCMGLPSGVGASGIDRLLMRSLAAIPGYRQARHHLGNQLHAVRKFRNFTVHNGFRQMDVPASELGEFDRLTYYGCNDVQHFAQFGIMSGLATASELRQRLPDLFQTRMREDVVRTRLESLERRDIFTFR